VSLQQWGVYWRDALVTELRKANRSAFAGESEWRLAYQGPTELLTPDSLTFQDGVLTLSDTPRNVVVLAAFPVWNSQFSSRRSMRDAEVNRAAQESKLQFLALTGPTGEVEAVYLRELLIPEDRILPDVRASRVPGGPAVLTEEGIVLISDFANAVARAADAFLIEGQGSGRAPSWLRGITRSFGDRTVRTAGTRR